MKPSALADEIFLDLVALVSGPINLVAFSDDHQFWQG